MSSQLKVYSKTTETIYKVYGTHFDEDGIYFLIYYDGRGWRYMPADLFSPVGDDV